MRFGAVVLLLGWLALFASCSGGSDATAPTATSGPSSSPTLDATEDTPPVASASAGVPAEFAGLGDLAVSAVEYGPVVIGVDGGTISTDRGIILSIADGALPDDASVTVTEVALEFGGIDVTVGETVGVVVESSLDVESFGAPVAVEFPFGDGPTWAGRLEEGTWVAAEYRGGAVVLDRFSTNAVVVATGWAEGLSDWLKWEDPTEADHREKVEASDQPTQDFYGVGETTSRTHGDICEEIWATVSARPEWVADVVGDLPADYGITDLFNFLRAADQPSTTQAGSKLWDYTKASHAAIQQRILAHNAEASGPLTPAQVLAIATEENDGNLAFGVLAAHNVLKEVAYAGRLQADPGDEGIGGLGETVSVSPELGEIASKLETWRRESPLSPKGRYDKMGPLYHLFASMTARVWSNSPTFGVLVVAGESFLRTIGFGNDVPDPEKGAADECGRTVGGRLMQGNRVFKGSGTLSSSWDFFLLGQMEQCTLDVDFELTLKPNGDATLFVSQVAVIRNHGTAEEPDWTCEAFNAQLYSGTWQGDRPMVQANIVFGSAEPIFPVEVRDGMGRATASRGGEVYSATTGTYTQSVDISFVLEEVYPGE